MEELLGLSVPPLPPDETSEKAPPPAELRSAGCGRCSRHFGVEHARLAELRVKGLQAQERQREPGAQLQAEDSLRYYPNPRYRGLCQYLGRLEDGFCFLVELRGGLVEGLGARCGTGSMLSRMSKTPSGHPEEELVQEKQPDLKRLPARPKLARMEEEHLASIHSPRLTCREVTNDQTPQADLGGSTLAAGKLETMNVIRAFLKERPKQTDKKLRFLASIPAACSMDSTLRELLCFSKLELVENIKMLLAEDCSSHLDTMVQQQAMLAIISMSRARLLLQEEIKGLLQLCFQSVFYLPEIEDPQDNLPFIFSETLATMDLMLQELVRNAGSLGLLELQNIFQVLVPFTISEPAKVQERAMARIAVLTEFMTTYPPLQDCSCFLQATHLQEKCSREHCFGMLGMLLAHLTLSCTCKHKGTSLQAAEALHHLHIFILQHLRKSPWWHDTNQPEEKPEEPPEIAYTERSLIFMKFLQPSQQTDILLLAIKNMSLPEAYPMDMVTRMVDVLLLDSAFQLEDVRKIMKSIYETLHFIMEETLVDSLNRVLLALMHRYPSRTVESLIECSPMCNRVAMSMWEAIDSSLEDAEKVLLELIRMLLNRSPCEISPNNSLRVTSVAAAVTIRQILLQPNFLQKAKEFFPQLFVALLSQVSFTTELTLEEMYIWSGPLKDRVSPVRSAVWSMRTLLSHMGFGSQVLAIEKHGGWDALLCTQTSLAGVCVVAREMKNMPEEGLLSICRCVAELLHEEDTQWGMVAMAFVVEIMSSTSLSEELDGVLEFFPTHMQSRCLGMRRLVLKCIPRLLSRPSTKLTCLTQERQTLTLLPLVMEQLQEDESYNMSLALLILENAIQLLPEEERSLTALELAEKVQPLFDHESSTVRKLSICTFQKAMQCASAFTRGSMTEEVWRSLLPLVFHTYDEDERVSKASREALRSAGRFLKSKKLLEVAETAETSRINEWLVTKKEKVQHYLQQSKLYLQSQQEPLRLEAARFIGFLGRKVNKEDLESIMEALQNAQEDKSPMVRCLATQMAHILRESQT